ncbi:MAG TPA: SLC13 family permease [Steroidobacteraceae bacterium]|nr:SLC13 family permease [Steroidobacteraceae bacterium]
MDSAFGAPALVWLIAGLSIFGIVVRPWRVSEAVWASLGAGAALAFSLISWRAALAAIGDGDDVYLFLTGMMLLAELARREGLFAWTAALATRCARGSPRRMFLLIYGVGIVVTAFLSNDATAVVLTPAVYAAAKDADAPPLPYLMICAFVANAASFVLPISNPANLVVYGTAIPPLGRWLAQFAAPSAAAIAATYLVLRLTQRKALVRPIAIDPSMPPLGAGGRLAAAGIVATAVLLAASSALDRPLGPPTLLCAAAVWIAILVVRRSAPWGALRSISWSVLPLVAALFVMVRAIELTGVTMPLVHPLAGAAAQGAQRAAGAAAIAAVASNVFNNLPVGLVAAHLIVAAHASARVAGALLIGVDLGPNLSVTGSLATILWLLALRREAVEVSAWRFLRLGAIAMPLSLLAALACYLAFT